MTRVKLERGLPWPLAPFALHFTWSSNACLYSESTAVCASRPADEALVPPILAIDPGEVRIGIAVSDTTGTIARPLHVLRHRSRAVDVAAIVGYAQSEHADRIVVGVALDLEGNVGPQARRALRLVEALRAASHIPVELWDESGSTQAAATSRRSGEPDDARAAAAILQDYLDAQKPA